MVDETKKTPAKSSIKRKVDVSILSDEVKNELRVKAKAQVADEKTKAAKAQYLEQLLAEERRETGLDEPMVECYIDLAPYADRIMIDGVVYFQGRTVKVRESVKAVMMEMMQATWQHQSVIDGKPESFYRKSRSQHISPSGAVSHGLRA